MNHSKKAREITANLKYLSKSERALSLNQLRSLLALERVVARLEAHPKLGEHLVFKGGFVLFKTFKSDRFTRDVDALARDISKTSLPKMVSHALSLDLDDAFWFGDVQTLDLIDQGEQGGYRFTCAYQLGELAPDTKVNKLSRLHIDIGLGDMLSLPPEKGQMTSLLPETAPVSWLVYPVEAIAAEKLQTLIVRASANSRAKDVFDLALILPKCTKPVSLTRAIKGTFDNRKTPLPPSFRKAADDLDTTAFETAWKAVQLTCSIESFETVWKKLLKYLSQIDRYLA